MYQKWDGLFDIDFIQADFDDTSIYSRDRIWPPDNQSRKPATNTQFETVQMLEDEYFEPLLLFNRKTPANVTVGISS